MATPAGQLVIGQEAWRGASFFPSSSSVEDGLS